MLQNHSGWYFQSTKWHTLPLFGLGVDSDGCHGCLHETARKCVALHCPLEQHVSPAVVSITITESFLLLWLTLSCSLSLQYVVETRFVGERAVAGAGTGEIIDVKERVVEGAEPGPRCPANAGGCQLYWGWCCIYQLCESLTHCDNEQSCVTRAVCTLCRCTLCGL